MEKSCADCLHCLQWSYSDTRFEPGDSGWECEHPELEWIENSITMPDGQYLEFNDDREAEKIANSCPFYQYTDREEGE